MFAHLQFIQTCVSKFPFHSFLLLYTLCFCNLKSINQACSRRRRRSLICHDCTTEFQGQLGGQTAADQPNLSAFDGEEPVAANKEWRCSALCWRPATNTVLNQCTAENCAGLRASNNLGLISKSSCAGTIYVSGSPWLQTHSSTDETDVLGVLLWHI